MPDAAKDPVGRGVVMRTEAPAVVEGLPDEDVDAIVAAVHEALGGPGPPQIQSLRRMMM